MVIADNNKTISVIVRFHEGGNTEWLDHALFSLATQSYQNIEVLLVVQNGDKTLLQKLYQVLESQPFIIEPEPEITDPGDGITTPGGHRILSIESGGRDARSKLLNQGLKSARGRYIAFLDYDDVVYADIYTRLIDQLKKSVAAIAVGGCRVAELITNGTDFPIVKHKHMYSEADRDLADLFVENFIPIHSYVLDRFKLQNKNEFFFNENLTYLEDYLFLLQLAAKYAFDFELLEVPLAEYRIRDDGSNSVLAGAVSPAKQQRWHVANQVIETEKERIFTSLSLAQLAKIKKGR